MGPVEEKIARPQMPINRKQRRDIARNEGGIFGGGWKEFNSQYPKKQPIMLGIRKIKKVLPKNMIPEYKTNAWGSLRARLDAIREQQAAEAKKKSKKTIIRKKV